ncbi:MAG: anti-sigma factor [bacterium]
MSLHTGSGGRHLRPDDEPHDASHGEWDELAVGYALSALEPGELGRFVEHLVTFCPQCQASVDDMNAVGASLVNALPIPEPSADLRTSVLGVAFSARPPVPQSSADIDDADLIQTDASTARTSTGAGAGISNLIPAPPDMIGDSHADDDAVGVGASTTGLGATRGATDRAAASATAAAPDGSTASVTDLGARRADRARSGRLGWTLAAAAAVLAVVLGVATFLAVSSRNHQADLAGAREQAITSLLSGSGQVVPLRTDGGKTVAAVVARRDTVSVVSSNIPVNAADKTYVLWGIAGPGKDPVALGVFDVRKSGLQTAKVGADSRGGYTRFPTFAVSREPGHSPPAKPSVVVALGSA